MDADLERIRQKLEWVLAAAGDRCVFTAVDYARGVGFQRHITPTVYDVNLICGITALEDTAIALCPERGRQIFDQEIAKARARAQAEEDSARTVHRDSARAGVVEQQPGGSAGDMIRACRPSMTLTGLCSRIARVGSIGPRLRAMVRG